MQTIKIHAPATIANLVCGFDILGLALDEPFDEITATLSDLPGVRIRHTDHYGLPEEASWNVAGVALQAMLEEYGKPMGVDLVMHKNIMPGSGLGSSAASSAGAVVALNELLGKPFSNPDLVRFAMNGEKLASGVKHADNITPAIYGGVTLIRSIFPLDIVPLSAPPMYVAVVHPQIEVKTSDARQILRKELQLKNAIRQWGNIAGLVTGLLKEDYDLIGRSLEDVVVEPIRSILIPGFDEVRLRAKEAGALGGGISGSGPSLFMLCKEKTTAEQVSVEMKDVYTKLGLDHRIYVTRVNHHGVKEVSL